MQGLLGQDTLQIFADKDEVAGENKTDNNSFSKQTCPLLTDWVNSDFKDKPFSIGFSNTAKKCLAESKKAYDKLTDHKNSPIIKTEELGSFYSKKFKHKILESYQDKYLKQCQSPALDDTKKRALQTRFYASAAKIEATNSTIVDEIAYYDSILPAPYTPLHGIDCKTAFLEVNDKCLEYKKQAKECKDNQAARFENLIEKTKNNLKTISELEKAHRICLTKTSYKYKATSAPNTQTNEKCSPIFQAIELAKDQTPWVRGDTFSSIAIKTKPSYRNNYQTEYDDSKIIQAVSDQLHKNRQALVKTFNINSYNFQCLINNADDSECDFKKIRAHLASQPDVKTTAVFPNSTLKDQEASIQIESDQCLQKYEDDLYQLHNTIKEVGYTIVLTGATLGMGWVSGLKAINSVSKLGRSLAIANGTFGAVVSGVDLKHTYQECSQESKVVIDLSTKTSLATENVCSKEDSPLSQAQAKETDCLLGVLLSTPGILPFLGATPGLMKLATSANRSTSINRSAKSARNVSEELLKSNAQQMQNLVARNDLDGARALIRSQMNASRSSEVSPSEVEAILKAHTDPKAACAIGKCTSAQLDEKVKIMKKAGLSVEDRRLAIEKGLAGNLDEINIGSLYNKLKASGEEVKDLELDELDQLALDLQKRIKDTPATHSSYTEQQLLKKVEVEAKARRDLIKKEENAAMLRQLQADHFAAKKARELEVRNNSALGAPLKEEQKTEISNLTQTLLKTNPNHLTEQQVKLINQYSKELNEKKKWKQGEYNGLIPDDDKLANEFASALDKTVKRINEGSSQSEMLAKTQGRYVSLPTVERNFRDLNGSIHRESVISTSGARNAKSDETVISTHLLTASPNLNTRNLEGYLRYKPVIQKNGELNDLANKLTNQGITRKELEDANIISTLDLHGLERFPHYRSDAFELAEKINEMKQLGSWSQVEATLSNPEKETLNKILQVVEDHQRSYRREDVRALKKFDESH